jgi:putative SOS response-associated peptidase YedK
LAAQFALFEMPPFTPRFNIAPSQPVAVIRLAGETADSPRELCWFRWGLIPSWAKDPAIGNRMINARAETVADKPAYRQAFRRRRCLVAADGFYEWQRTGKRKQPYFIHMHDDRPFGFAGLWETWEGPDRTEVQSCTLLTTEANDLVRPIHDRMPVILSEDDYQQWLDPSVQKPELLIPLLRPHPSEPMGAYAVSTLVNNPGHEDPQCVEPSQE